MTRTYPDWGKSSGDISSPDIDLTELGSRISKISPLRRDGRLVYYDDFEEGISGWRIFDGVAYTTIERAYMGSACLRINGSIVVPFYETRMGKRLPYISRSPMGLEFTFSPVAATKTFSVSLQAQGKAELLTAKVILKSNENKIYLFNDVGGESLLTSVPIYDTSPHTELTDIWHNLKLVVDFETKSYLRLYYDGYQLDLSSAPNMYTSATVESEYIEVTLASKDTTGAEGPVYFDNLLITTDEFGA